MNNYNYVLDKCLEFTLKRVSQKGNFEKLDGSFPDRTHLDILKEYMERELKLEFYEIIAVINQLTEDGYIYNEEYVKITLKGIQFIKNGGYSKEFRRIKIQTFFDNIELFAIVSGSVSAFLYYSYELFLKKG